MRRQFYKLQRADGLFDGIQHIVLLDQRDRGSGLVAHIEIVVLEFDPVRHHLIGDGRSLAELEPAKLLLRDINAAARCRGSSPDSG